MNMNGIVFTKRTAFVALFILFGVRAYASGVNDPVLRVNTISESSRQIIIDWTGVKNPENYRYGLYRANRENRTIELVQQVNPGMIQITDNELSSELYNYYYFINHVGINSSLDPYAVFPSGRKISDDEMMSQLATLYPIPESGGESYSENASPYNMRLTGAAATRSSQRMHDGLYVGLAFFSNKVDTTVSLIPLDPAGRREIVERLNVNYVPARSNGTALFYAEHQALEILSSLDKAGKLPANVDSVNIITFTDGLDTSSTDVALPPPSKEVNFAGRHTAAYMNYINQQIKTRKVAGKKINAWAIGIPGRDVTNGGDFIKTLEAVASSPNQVSHLSNLSQVEDQLQAVADAINMLTPISRLTFTVPAYSVGTMIRITFDEGAVSPEGSSRYFEGRIAHNGANNTYSLTALVAQGLTLAVKTPVEGKRTIDGIEYTIVLNDVFDERSLMQWYKQQGYAGNSWQYNSELRTHKISDFMSSRKSGIIYLVLDCSSSLANYEIDNIRTSVTRFIDKVFNAAATSVMPDAALAGRYEGEITEIQTTEDPSALYVTPQYSIGQVYVPNGVSKAPLGTQLVPARPQQVPQQLPQQYYPETRRQYTPPATRYDNPVYTQPYRPKTQPSYRPVPGASVTTQRQLFYELPYAQALPQQRPAATALLIPAPTVNMNEPYSGFWVQVGSFNDLGYAQDAWRRLFYSNCPNTEIFAREMNGIMYYRVKVGPYQDRPSAEYAMNTIRAANIGFNDAYVVRQ